MDNSIIVNEISRLKQKYNAVIIAHLYQWPEIQDIADFVGDSLDLSRKARDTSAEMIVFCGVWFMAETAKILSPQKRVLIPEMDAGCPMADMISADDVFKLRQDNPEAVIVCYVNSSAEIKAMSDICCTSSNAVSVVRSLTEKKVVFIPDRNLGHYVSRFAPEKEFVFFDGFCPTHNKITVRDVENVRALHPQIPILVHPECRPEIVDSADFTGSTAQIIDYAVKSGQQEFIIGTESGIIHRLQQLCPEKRFFTLHAAMLCPNMKKTSLQSVLHSLQLLQYEINLDPDIISRASLSLNRMLSVKSASGAVAASD